MSGGIRAAFERGSAAGGGGGGGGGGSASGGSRRPQGEEVEEITDDESVSGKKKRSLTPSEQQTLEFFDDFKPFLKREKGNSKCYCGCEFSGSGISKVISHYSGLTWKSQRV